MTVSVATNAVEGLERTAFVCAVLLGACAACVLWLFAVFDKVAP